MSSAVAYTIGLNEEPGCRIAWVARLNWRWSEEKPPTMASTRPVDGSITTMAADKMTLPVEGFEVKVTNPPSPIKDEWQRWNDYGIGLFLEGKKGELRQSEEVLKKGAALGRLDGHISLARGSQADGKMTPAAENSAAARREAPPASTSLDSQSIPDPGTIRPNAASSANQTNEAELKVSRTAVLGIVLLSMVLQLP